MITVTLCIVFFILGAFAEVWAAWLLRPPVDAPLDLSRIKPLNVPSPYPPAQGRAWSPARCFYCGKVEAEHSPWRDARSSDPPGTRYCGIGAKVFTPSERAS